MHANYCLACCQDNEDKPIVSILNIPDCYQLTKEKDINQAIRDFLNMPGAKNLHIFTHGASPTWKEVKKVSNARPYLFPLRALEGNFKNTILCTKDIINLMNGLENTPGYKDKSHEEIYK